MSVNLPQSVERVGLIFIRSVGVILVVAAVAKLASATGQARALESPDPLLMVTYRWVLILAGSVEFAVAAFVLFSHQESFKLALIAWLAWTFLIYRLGLVWVDTNSPCGCLGTLTTALGFAPESADLWMKGALIYMLVGTAVLVVMRRLANVH